MQTRPKSEIDLITQFLPLVGRIPWMIASAKGNNPMINVPSGTELARPFVPAKDLRGRGVAGELNDSRE